MSVVNSVSDRINILERKLEVRVTTVKLVYGKWSSCKAATSFVITT